MGGQASYAFLHWEQAPAPSVANGVGGAESFGAGVQLGLDWFFLEHLGLTAGGRADFYGLGTTVDQGGASSILNDSLGVSALGGLVVRLDRPQARPQPSPQPPAVCECNCGFDSAIGTGDGDSDGVIDASDQCPDTLLGVPVGATGCALPDFAFDIEFEYAQFTLHKVKNRPQFRIIAFLDKHKDFNVEITGHTDDRGTPDYNADLARLRAWEAKQFPVDHGVDEARVRTEGRGDDEPVFGNDSKEKRARNRRIHVRFYDSTKAESSIEQGDDGKSFDDSQGEAPQEDGEAGGDETEAPAEAESKGDSGSAE